MAPRTFAQHIRDRARSVQLDQPVSRAVASAVNSAESTASANKLELTTRVSSLNGHELPENAPPLRSPVIGSPPSVPFSGPAAIRHYRSMLDVEEPPRIGPVRPLSYDGLYDNPIQQNNKSDRRHSHGLDKSRGRPKQKAKHKPRDRIRDDKLARLSKIPVSC